MTRTLFAAAGAVSLAVLAAGTLFAAGRRETAEPLSAYVANAVSGTVSAVSLDGTTPSRQIPLGGRAAHGIAASPDGRIVYAGNAESHELLVIDGLSGEIVSRAGLSHDVHGIDIAPDGRSVWIGGSRDGDPLQGTLSIVETAGNVVAAVVAPGVGSASHFSLTPDGREVWVASSSTNLLWIVSTATAALSGVVPMPAGSSNGSPDDDGWGTLLAERSLLGLNEVAISPDGRFAYAVGPASSTLYKIDVRRRAVVDQARVGSRAHGVTVRPGGREVWIADWDGHVRILDASSLAELESVTVATADDEPQRRANHVAFDRAGRRAYVSSVDALVVIDAQRRRIIETISVGQEPHEISLEDWAAPGARLDTDAMLRAARGGDATRPATLQGSAGSNGVGSNGTGSIEAASASAQDGAAVAAGLASTLVSVERAVTVEVTPHGLAGGGIVELSVAMDTHSVDLSYDLLRLATLRDSLRNEYRPAAWEASAGGHHVRGTLRFKDVASLPSGAGGWFELEIRRSAARRPGASGGCVAMAAETVGTPDLGVVRDTRLLPDRGGAREYLVEIVASGTCSSCALVKHCAGAGSAVWATARQPLAVGQTVHVEADPGTVTRAAGWVYGVPLLALGTGLFGGYSWLFGRLPETPRTVLALVAGALLMAAAGAAIARLQRRIASRLTAHAWPA